MSECSSAVASNALAVVVHRRQKEHASLPGSVPLPQTELAHCSAVVFPRLVKPAKLNPKVSEPLERTIELAKLAQIANRPILLSYIHFATFNCQSTKDPLTVQISDILLARSG